MIAPRRALNFLVRAYLRRSPITTGKKQLLRACRSLIFPDEQFVTVGAKHGFRMRLNLADPGHHRLYFYGEHDERYEINNLAKILRPGDTCWDIGANIGSYTCFFAAKVGPSGKVVAFEPVARTADFVQRNIEINAFSNVTLVRKAVADFVGRRPIFFNTTDQTEGTASLNVEGGARSEIVDVDTIDNVVGSLPAPDLIKIDVEGSQKEVFDGARTFFSRHAPMLMAELRHESTAVTQALQERLRRMGYRVFVCHKRCLKPCHDIATSRHRNFFLVQPESKYFQRVEPLVC